MAAYNSGRRNGPNVSAYIADLNKEPSAFEVARADENFNLDSDLAQWTNAQFLEDFDTGNLFGADGAAGFGFEEENLKDEPAGPSTGAKGESQGLDFINGDFPIQGLDSYNVPVTSPTNIPQIPQHQQFNFPAYTLPISPPAANATPTSPTLTTSFPSAQPQIQQSSDSTAAAAAASASSPTDSTSDPSRAHAEEDKRRRNTAASARFRVKKKQREQALEKKTQELEREKQVLEQRIGKLTEENEWLRGLVVEKNANVGGGGKGGAETVAVAAAASAGAQRSPGEEKRGVGTVGQGMI